MVGLEVVSKVTDDRYFLRPPGAQDEKDFLSKCIRCGKCIASCPYFILEAAGAESGGNVGTPCFNDREGACRLCADFPCVKACPSGALSTIEERSDVSIGTAVINRDHCIALKGIRCEVCFRSCPLNGEAITIKHSPREGDPIHIIFEPVVNTEKCVGCGICVERCVISSPVVAIRVVPHSEIYTPS